MANITKEFLEKALGQPIEKFECNSGSNLGDGYTSLLSTVDVTLPNKEVQHILVKCYPIHLGRQEWLNQTNLFLKELAVYDTLVPALSDFQKTDVNPETPFGFIRPPVPNLVFGQAIDYKKLPAEDLKKHTDPLANCIIMPDLRKTGNFRLANRLVGFDLDHSKLVIVGQAKIHALGWAYKMRSGGQRLQDKFSFLNYGTFFDDMDDAMMGGMYDNSLGLFRGVIEACAADEEEKARLIKSLEGARASVFDVAALFFCDRKTPRDPATNKDNVTRIPSVKKVNEASWDTVTHGDCWLNNMMFRYDDETGKPLEVIMVDLQLVREAEPMNDLVYSMYTSTTSVFRKLHLNYLLQLYTDTFIKICHHFNVPLPGDFGVEEVKRRFHRAKAFGFLMSFMCFPLFLNDPKDAKDLDQMGENISMDDMGKEFSEMTSAMGSNPRFQSRVMDIVRELHEEGII